MWREKSIVTIQLPYPLALFSIEGLWVVSRTLDSYVLGPSKGTVGYTLFQRRVLSLPQTQWAQFGSCLKKLFLLMSWSLPHCIIHLSSALEIPSTVETLSYMAPFSVLNEDNSYAPQRSISPADTAHPTESPSSSKLLCLESRFCRNSQMSNKQTKVNRDLPLWGLSIIFYFCLLIENYQIRSGSLQSNNLTG